MLRCSVVGVVACRQNIYVWVICRCWGLAVYASVDLVWRTKGCDGDSGGIIDAVFEHVSMNRVAAVHGDFA